MKYFNLSIIFLLSLRAVSFADTFVPYYGFTEYSDSLKDESKNYGLYYSSENTKMLIDYQDVTYTQDNNISSDINTSGFSQTNIAFQYNFNSSDSTSFHTTINYINSSNNEYDGAYIATVGVKEKFNSFDLGLNYSYSKYDNTLVSTVQQFSPSLSFSFGDYKSLMGNYNVKILSDLIYPSTNTNINGLSSNYSSYGISLTQNKGNFQNSIQYYSGDHIFAVRDDGMSVQNFEDIYKNSLSLSCKYNFSKTTSMQISHIRKDFVEYGSTSEMKLANTILFLYYNF